MASSTLPTLGGRQLWADVRYSAGYRVQRHVWTGHHRLLDPQDRRLDGGDLDRCSAGLDAAAPDTPGDGDRVVLLHGLGRSRRCFEPLSRRLRSAGHEPIALDYPSTRGTIEEHADQVADLLTHLPGRGRLAFVTHSLGGLVARRLLSLDDARWQQRHRPSRMVMIAPPSRGSSLARRLKPNAVFSLVLGPAGGQVAEQVTLAPPPIPFLVVAGTLRGGRGGNPLLRGDDDGIVTVEETHLDGAERHLQVPEIHTLLMQHPKTMHAVVDFLADG